ncbi:MFS transporter [Bdellovibrio sp. HCB-110]|uniref:MFS transporter n=1 Tax=Bdellovibrio sp. HCB-110 TaxID=3391182 RepID=UPI0039B466FC
MNKWKWQFWLVFGAAFSVFFSIAILIPVLPLFIHDKLRLGDVAVGVIMGLQPTGAVGSRMLIGRATSKYGIWRTLAFGTSLCALGSLLFLLPSSASVFGIARFLQGFGEGFTFTAGTTWVIATAPSQQKGRLVSLFGLSLWLGATIGPMVGGFVNELQGFLAVVILAIIPPAIFGIISFFQLSEPLGSTSRLDWIPKESVAPGITLALASTGFVAVSTFGALYFSSRAWDHGSWMVVAYGLGFVLMRVLGGHWIDRYSSARVASGSAALAALGMLLIVVSSHWLVTVFGSLLGGLGLALMYPALAIESVRGVEPAKQGNVLGWYTAFWDLSLLGSNFTFGWLAAQRGYPSVFVVSCVASVFCVGFVLAKARRRLQSTVS